VVIVEVEEESMRVCALFVLVVVSACSSSSHKATPDAKMIDAPAALVGLGQPCTTVSTNSTECPANAPECQGFTNGHLFCTPVCLNNATGTTDNSNPPTFPTTGAGALNPLPNDGICTAAFTGTAGIAACAAIVSVTPMDAQLQPNKAYTNIKFDCAIGCGTGNACPTGTTCNTTIGACEP
jgi:hypothetical protein